MGIDTSLITGWVQPEQILLDVEVHDRSSALDFIATAIGRRHGLEPAPIARALARREQAGSTALGNGFAIPHACIDGLDRPLTLFVRTKVAIDFAAPDHKPVSDLLAIMVPTNGDRQAHLDLLVLIATLFTDAAFRTSLDTAPDAASAAAVFRDGVGGIDHPASSRRRH